MNSLSELLKSVYRPIHDKKEFVQRLFMSNYMPTLLFYYSRTATTISLNIAELYDNNIVVRNVTDYSVYFCKYIYSVLIHKRLEPLSQNWICSSVLSKRDKNRYIGEEYTLLESYDFIKNSLMLMNSGRTICETNFNETCYAMDPVVSTSETYIEGLVKMRVDNKYIYRVFRRLTDTDQCNGDSRDNNLTEFVQIPFSELTWVPLRSNANFLSIEYVHPLMKEGIVIELDRSVYFAGNQILSPTFVKSYLEHQSELYHFDMDYMLKIMDDTICSITMNADKYILLKENGYQVV
jgi:hypothetical protein